MRFSGHACLLLALLALVPGAAHSYGDVYVLVQHGAASDDDLAFGEGSQLAQAALAPTGVGVSGSAYTLAGPGEVGGSVQLDVASGTPFSFSRSDQAGGAAEGFLSDVWLPTLPGHEGELVSLTLRVHATGSGETLGNPSVLGALGSNVLIDAGVFEAFGPGFAGAVSAEAQLGYQATSGLPPGFVAPFFTGEWSGGGDWTVTTDAAASLQTFSYESWLELPFQWTVGTAFEVDLFAQYFAGWCCANVDATLDAPIHASLAHALRYELEASNPELQLVRVPEPAPGLLLAAGLWLAVARSRGRAG